jgi:tetratricopeptide (TPR) repeat protein
MLRLPTSHGSATTGRAPIWKRRSSSAPHNARALYYLALVERIQGNPDAAVADLRDVMAQFPRSRDAHRELGFLASTNSTNTTRRAEYETVQSIDPDDLAAHYILSIVYRRLGMKDKQPLRPPPSPTRRTIRRPTPTRWTS